MREGTPADLIAVDADRAHLAPITPEHDPNDPLSFVVYAASGRDVTTTAVDGEVLMADREVRTLDAERIGAEARAAADPAGGAVRGRVKRGLTGCERKRFHGTP